MITRSASASLLLPLLFAWGCRPAPKDTSRVIATAGDQKITEHDFVDLVKSLSPDAAQTKAFLTSPADRDRRAQLANQMAMQKAVVAFANLQGLAKDPKVQRQLEIAEAQVYFQAMVQKRMEGVVPTEEQLRTFYDKRVAEMKAQGQGGGVPPFEMVKPQLPNLWLKARGQEIAQEVQQEIQARVPITMADDYKPVGQ